MILSQTTVYALKAVMYLAAADPGESIRVDDMANKLDVPRNYLSKILHSLARSNILDSTRGPKGGFRLVARPEDLPLEDIVSQFQEVSERPQCFLGREECSDSTPCAAHDHWKGASTAMHRFFKETTVADLSHHG